VACRLRAAEGGSDGKVKLKWRQGSVVGGRRGGKLPFYGPSLWRSGDGAQGHLEEGSVDRCGGIGAWHSSGWHRDASGHDCSHGGMCISGDQLLQ
jgi:hypothetical protein